MTDEAAIADTLIAHGIPREGSDAPDYGIHSWRCSYYRNLSPEVGGGPCSCFGDLVSALSASPSPAPDKDAAAVEALDVARLAKALCIEHGPEFDEARLHVDDACHVQARSVAATYARLARAYEAAPRRVDL